MSADSSQFTILGIVEVITNPLSKFSNGLSNIKGFTNT